MTRLAPHSVLRPRSLRARAAVLALLVVALAGCNGDDNPGPDEDSSSPTSAASEPTVPITNKQAARIKPKMSHQRVLEILGDPLLIQDPHGQFTGGCLYYAMENRTPADVWQFCFNDEGINVVLTAFSPNQPAPPEGASDARAALLARADTFCQGQYGYLTDITNKVGDAILDFSGNPSDKNLEAVVTEIEGFITNLKVTLEGISAFRAPEDDLETFTAYTDDLTAQIDALTSAKEALAERDLDAYDDFGTEFNDISKEARTAAREYGFSICSAPDFG